MSRAVNWLRDKGEEWRTAVVVTDSRSLLCGLRGAGGDLEELRDKVWTQHRTTRPSPWYGCPATAVFQGTRRPTDWRAWDRSWTRLGHRWRELREGHSWGDSRRRTGPKWETAGGVLGEHQGVRGGPADQGGQSKPHQNPHRNHPSLGRWLGEPRTPPAGCARWGWRAPNICGWIAKPCAGWEGCTSLGPACLSVPERRGRC